MTSSREALLSEVTSQLEDDILSFGWLQQIVGDFQPELDSDAATLMVCELIVELVGGGVADVGRAIQDEGVVCVKPWPERGPALFERLQASIKETRGTVDFDFCFWLEMTD